jgi:hypothetical protein
MMALARSRRRGAHDARVAVGLDAVRAAAAPAAKLTRQTAIACDARVAAAAGDLDQHERAQTPDSERASSRLAIFPSAID